jgi:lipocalin
MASPVGMWYAFGMEPRFTWAYNEGLAEYEVRDNEEAVIVARCETKEDAKRVHHALTAVEVERHA